MRRWPGARWPDQLDFLHGFGVGLGVAAVGLLPSAGTSFAPAGRLSWGGSRGLGLRLSLVGPGSTVAFDDL